jgi:hypothetical protein
MGFLDRLLGREDPAPAPRPAAPRRGAETDDERAVERYRYLVRTAPPDRLEEAHREAFEGLTPEQRRLALQDLNAVVPESERATSDDPRSLARTATRAEMREPGTVERAFGRGGLGGGIPLLPLFMTTFVGTLAAQALFSELAGDSGDSGDSGESGDSGDSGDGSDASGADAGDAGGGDYGGGGDAGGGGDWGGGDLGGGDFGGF